MRAIVLMLIVTSLAGCGTLDMGGQQQSARDDDPAGELYKNDGPWDDDVGVMDYNLTPDQLSRSPSTSRR